MSNAASAGQSLASKIASAASSAAASASASSASPSSPQDTSSTPAAAGAAATDFCGAFKELESVGDAKDPAAAAAAFHQAAADMRKYAPAEISQAATTYADAVEAVANALGSGATDGASALTKDLAKNPQDMAKVAVYVAKNCK